MILPGIDCTEQYEAMKRGEWPEPHPEVVAAHKALALQVVVVDRTETEEGDGRDDG